MTSTMISMTRESPSPRSKPFNMRTRFWDKNKVCPACRGYDLEKQWCGVCRKTGFVPKQTNP
jgi:hypothetical protein